MSHNRGVLSLGLVKMLNLLVSIQCAAILVAGNEYGNYVKDVTLRTRLGTIVGEVYDVNSSSVIKFKGIPYAKPPVNDLRFMKPEKVDHWTSPLNATVYGPACVQSLWYGTRRLRPSDDLSEDCLQLNLYIPRTLTPSTRLAVMIWVHGGSFIQGQATTFDGSSLALHGDVIVVTINYRLNVFGYLSTDDPRVKGNVGMYDQQMAFQWVKDNIADYGGDPGRITLFGQSAGALSITLQALIPQNMGLFQRVIGQSGSGLEPKIVSTHATKNSSLDIAIELKCSPDNKTIDVSCLQSVSADDLFAAYKTVKGRPKSFYSQHGNFYPVIDNELIHADLIQRLHNSHSREARMLSSVDLLMGSVEGEGGWIYWSLYEYQKRWNINASVGISDTVLCDKVLPAITLEKYYNCTSISQAICSMYASNTSIADQIQLVSDMVNDFEVIAPTMLLLDLHARLAHRGNYQYLFSHLPAWELDSYRALWLKGPNHGSEVTFLEGLSWYPYWVKISPDERALSDRMMNYWTQFAKTGNPNSQGMKETWPAYRLPDRQYLDFNLTDSTGSSLHGSKIPFWNNQIPAELKRCNSEHKLGLHRHPDQLIFG